MRKKLSNTEHATRLRELYRSDPLYRLGQLEKARKQHQETYVKKPKLKEFVIDGVTYIKTPEFAKIANLAIGVLKRLINDGIVTVRATIQSSGHRLLLKSDAELIAKNLHRFIVNPSFCNIEKYDRLKLKQFLKEHCELNENKNI